MPLKYGLFSAYLIGKDRLLIACADILLARGHLILGVISPLPEVEQWASNHQIPYFKKLSFAQENLENSTFDYLFSIANSEIIPEFLLKRAKKFSVNYHDSPLPRYAGTNATCWAILNDEKEHAVTWHIVENIIDGGDILKQSIFKIDPKETAFSLNLKCYQHALQLFVELVDELLHQNYRRIPQDLSQRSYYGFHKKPEGNGWIVWNSPAEQLERFCRAFDFGHHTNRVSLLKFTIKNTVLIVNKLKVLSKKSGNVPGTLIKIAKDRWQIATKTNDIVLLKMSTSDGQPCSFKAIAKQYSLAEGECFFSPKSSLYKNFEKISIECSKHENFWVEKLLCFKPVELSFLPHSLLSNSVDSFVCLFAYMDIIRIHFAAITGSICKKKHGGNN